MSDNAISYEDFVLTPGERRDGGSSNPIEEVELVLARARGAAHADGFEAGKKSAEAAFDRMMTAKLDAVEKALMQAQDLMEGSEKSAHWAVVQLTKAFIHAVAPRLASSALAPEICAAIEDAIVDQPGALLVIEVAEDRSEEIAAAIDACTAMGKVKINSELGPTEARVYWDDGFDQIDPSVTIAKAMKILDARLAKTLKQETEARSADTAKNDATRAEQETSE